MRNSYVAAAVATALAAAVSQQASAQTTHIIYASGASAQRSFWEGDLGNVCVGTYGSTGVVTILSANSSGTPDIHFAYCTAVVGATTTRGSVAPPTGLANGDTVILEYGAELGSDWGIAPFIPGNSATSGRHYLSCSTTTLTCSTVSGYCRVTDSATSGLASSGTVPDLGVTDMEPVEWALEDNWPYVASTSQAFTALSPQPSLSQLTTYQGNAHLVNGQVFSPILNNGATPALTSISQQSLRAIFEGQYTTWAAVPEAYGLANSTQSITVCRRDHGSGTQVASSIYLTQTECGATNGTIVRQANGPNTPASYGNLTSAQVIENASTNDEVACVTNNAGAIGYRSLSPSSGYTTLAVNGIQAAAHNAAGGYYNYAYVTWTYNNSGNTANGQGDPIVGATVTNLIADAEKSANNALPAENTLSGNAGGPWTVAAKSGTTQSGPEVAYFSKSGGSGNTESLANLVTTTKAPTALFANGSSGAASCQIPANVNTN